MCPLILFAFKICVPISFILFWIVCSCIISLSDTAKVLVEKASKHKNDIINFFIHNSNLFNDILFFYISQNSLIKYTLNKGLN